MKKLNSFFKTFIALLLVGFVALGFSFAAPARVGAATAKTDVTSVAYYSHSNTSSNSIYSSASSDNGSFKYTTSSDYFKYLAGTSWYIAVQDSASGKMQIKFYLPGKASIKTSSSTLLGVTTKKTLNSVYSAKTSGSNTDTNKYVCNFSTSSYKSTGWMVAFSSTAGGTRTYYNSTSGTYSVDTTDTVYVHLVLDNKVVKSNASTVNYHYYTVVTFKVSLAYKSYIMGQSSNTHIANLNFGTKTVAKTGCGVVAAYNASKMLGKGYNFYTLLKYAHGLGESWENGSYPSDVEKFIKKTGCSYTKYTTYGTFLKACESGDKFIIEYNWDGGGHWISGKQTSAGYVIYDRYSSSTDTVTYEYLSTLWKNNTNGHFSVGYIVTA